ncbi:MAG: cytochrome c oxidase subunit I [Acidimicrobiales bacterium]
MTSVDHKKIGILYGITSFVFFILGGLEALALRVQLGTPDNTFLSPEAYNQMFTMHGTTMVFMVIMPLSAAFVNYLLPLMIGARDVAFPRMNAFSFWVFLFGGLFTYSSFFLGGAPNGGWFGYQPLGRNMGGHNIDFWVFGLQILGIASLTGAVNLIVTVINMRAPGMTLMRMPIFVWMSLVVQFLLLFALPVITVALFLLTFDRLFATNFFNINAGADPLLWQHLFWLFGHPEVYILILPAMGIVSEIIPVFARKPLFGYRVMVFSGIAIGLMGWGVWAHHMFATGIGPVALAAFGASTMFIAVPTGVKIFNWISTLWKGKITPSAPMLFAVGFVAMFTIGGLSGVTHAIVPSDTQQTDTYYIVAHFHYVLFGGSMFGLFGGAYYWWPKVRGHVLNDRVGKAQFWLMFLGFNMTFAPFHILGLQGQPRRTYTYPEGMGWEFWNFVASIGSFVIALSVLVFMYNVRRSARSAKPAGADPWDGRTLEWTIPSPAPEYNFAEIPVVTNLDDLWHRKYTEDTKGRAVLRDQRTDAELAAAANAVDQPERPDIHLPSPSYWPIFTALSLPVISYGMIYKTWVVAILGAVWILAGIFGWALEPQTDPDAGHGDHGHDDHDDHGHGAPTVAATPAAVGTGEAP